MPKHVTLSGHEIEYPEPSPAEAKFLARIQKIERDPKLTENNLIGVLYSKDNPLLDASIFPEGGAVTKEVLANPLYHVMTDLVARKRVTQDNVDVDALAATFSLPLSEAASKLGVHISALRQAIHARRLPSWVKDGNYFVKPESLATFQVRRGPAKATEARPIEFCAGHVKGTSFEVKHAGDLEARERVDKNVIAGRITRWQRIAVRVGGGEGQPHRVFILEPAATEEHYEFGPFYVRGHFKFAERINNARKAAKAWEEFHAA